MNKIQIYPTVKEVISKTASLFISSAADAINQYGVFSIALSGGSTPTPLYEFLAQDSLADNLAWNQIHFYWSDERPVPPDHPDSNFRQAYHSLLKPRLIPPENIHRIPGELDPITAAKTYQQEILSRFIETPARFNLVILGMGTDGHTASLFPGTKAVTNPQQNEWVSANHVPQHSSWRITFTPGLINAAEQVIFLVTGQSKAETLLKVLEGTYLPELYPSQLIKPSNGNLTWFIDQEAGRLLSSSQS
jgi:6-phosphogluconolactonase